MMQKKIKLAACGFAPPRFQHNTSFEDIGGGDVPCVSMDDRIQELASLGLR
jgi:hypothetical protein